MNRTLLLDRPLAVFDIEATGLNRRTDRIVELSLIKLLPDGKRESFLFRVNPGIPIPADSIAIHGITDDDVKDESSFKDLAPVLLDLLEGSCALDELRVAPLASGLGDREILTRLHQSRRELGP